MRKLSPGRREGSSSSCPPPELKPDNSSHNLTTLIKMIDKKENDRFFLVSIKHIYNYWISHIARQVREIYIKQLELLYSPGATLAQAISENSSLFAFLQALDLININENRVGTEKESTQIIALLKQAAEPGDKDSFIPMAARMLE